MDFDQALAEKARGLKREWLATYAPASLRADALAALGDLSRAMAAKRNAQDQVKALGQQIEEVKALILLNAGIDGKNAEIRAAQLTVALREDEAYQQLTAALRDAEREAMEAGEQMTVASTRLDLAKTLIRQGTAALELLAS